MKDQWLLHLRQRNLADTTITKYARNLSQFEAFLRRKNPWEAGTKEIEKYVSVLRKRVALKTFNQHLATLKSFYGYLYRSGHTPINLAKVVPKIREVRKVIKNVMNVQQVRKLILCPDLNKPLGYRDRTMLIVTYAGGLRQMELLGMKIDDVDEIKGTVIVNRKGGFTQEVPIGPLAMEYLSTYINEIRPTFSPSGNFVFVGRFGQPLDDSRAYSIIKKHMRASGLGRFTPHDLRHAAATHMKNKGANLRDIQQFLGHRSINSTSVYVRSNPRRIRAVVDKMSQ